jgi:hypothetical protein
MGATEMTTRRVKRRPAQPAAPQADDYALREYGVTAQELDRFVKRMKRQIARDRKAGTMKVYTGDLEADIAD